MDKVCINHPESPSVGACKACEKPVCLMCIVEIQGVSFCSDACGTAYQEVKDWLERPAADEEWNPLAEAAPKAPAANAPPPPAELPAPTEPRPAKTAARTPSGTEMRAALSSAFGDADAGKPADPSEEPPAPPSGPVFLAPNRTMLYVAIAATLLVVLGIGFLMYSPHEDPAQVARTGTPTAEPPPLPPAKPEPPKKDPPKPGPVKPAPLPEPPKPVIAKVEPPKPEPVKPPPPQPEPVKPEAPKPVIAKVEPPKPEPVKPLPPKPEPVKPPAPKPEPLKPEPPKPVPPKVDPPKPEPVKPQPPKPEIAKVEPPKPEPVKPPPPAPHLAFLRDPWGKVKEGTWYRIRTTANGEDSYRDLGLRESGSGYRVLVSQTSARGKTEQEQFTWTEPEDLSVMGSVNGEAQGTRYAADVVRTKASRPSQYVLKDGPHAGAVFPADAVLTRLALETLTVKDRKIACTVMETELKEPKRGVTTWFSPLIPLGTVKAESPGLTSSIVDFGDDWSRRPPFPAPPAPVIAKVEPPKPPPPPPPPPPKPEPPKPEPPAPPPPKPEPSKVEIPKPRPEVTEASARIRKSMSDAAGLIREATPMYQEVALAMESVPSDKAALRDLFGKAERVRMKLGDARILYQSVKSDAPDPAVLVRRVAQLDEILDAVQECQKQLKKKLE